MAERNISRPWSEAEDALLRQAVSQYGENDNWKIIAVSVPGRTNKACRKRWLHSLQPNVKKSAWTPSEDQLLLELYDRHGPKWSAIARQISGRTDDACSKRYREALDPNLKKDQWSPEEDEKLMEVFNRIGGKWGQVGQELQRSGLGCRNRWRLLERKKAAKTTQTQSPIQTIPVLETQSPALTFAQGVLPQDPSVPHWPPYYPPEAYTFPTDDGPRLEYTFREPTPEAVVIPDPHVAPFQFSSSSLSAALSDPPRPHRPLPPISAVNTPELVVQDTFNDSERQPSLSPLSQCNGIPEMNDVLMSLDDGSQRSMIQQAPLNIGILQPPYSPDRFQVPPLPDYGFYYSASPISITTELSRVLEPFSIDLWKARGVPDFDFDSPRSIFEGFASANDYQEDYSSSASTPFFLTNQLSPTSSPNPISPVDLPAPDLPSGGSLLFSPADGAQGNGVCRTKKTTSRKHKPSMKPQVATRLSSMLSLSDPSIKAYACGRPACWPAGETTSASCFATSGELLEHCKEQHSEDEVSEKPYRCALAGCEKSWKSINGLQYHLQISTAHFANALFNKFSKQPGTPIQQMASLSTEADGDDSDRKHVCPKPDCYKAYRQPSGLRYHIKHGHPADLPTQLDFVPPALERQMPTKAKKLRVKPLPDGLAAPTMTPIATSMTS